MCLKLENFKKIVDPLSKTLVGVSLSLTGEPLLNKEIVSLIAYLHEENIGVSFPTNFSLKLSDDQIESLVRSGLDSIMISLDGASAETYSKYRVGGDFDLVLRNVKSLAEAKKQLRSRRPIIIWKFIIFDHNRHETERVKSQFKALGFDAYEFMVDLRSVVHADQYQREKQDLVKSRRPCYWLWNTTIIRWNGAVDPCCNVSSFLQAPFNLGNALEKDIRDIWRGKEYQRLREGFVKKTYGLNMHPLCRRCMRCPAVGEYVEPG
jgi:MoaA/NifB/PqqE/SkfB family radical SAM enzyme